MAPTKAIPFELLSARLRWFGQRQVVPGRNVANSEIRPRIGRATCPAPASRAAAPLSAAAAKRRRGNGSFTPLP